MLQKSLRETTFEATASRFEFSSEFRMKSRSNKVGEGVTCRIGIRCPPARERSERAVEIGFSVPGKGFSPLPLHPPWQGNGGRGRACVWNKGPGGAMWEKGPRVRLEVLAGTFMALPRKR